MPSGLLPTGIGEPTTRPVFGSRRVTVLSSLLVTHTKPWPKASWRGSRPTLVVPSTSPVLRSRRVTVPSPALAIQAALGGLDHAARLDCRREIGSPTTCAVDGSMRVTVSSPELVTHTKRRPTKIPAGLEPTPIGAADDRRRGAVDAVDRVVVEVGHPHELLAERDRLRPVADGHLGRRDDLAVGLEALRRRPSRRSRATRRPCRPRSRPGACPPSSGSPTASSVSGSITDSVPPCWLATNTLPPLTATPSGPLPDLDRGHGLRARPCRASPWPRAERSPWPAAVAVASAVTVAAGFAVLAAADHAGRGQPGRGQPGDEHGRQPDPDRQLPPPARDLLVAGSDPVTIGFALSGAFCVERGVEGRRPASAACGGAGRARRRTA